MVIFANERKKKLLEDILFHQNFYHDNKKGYKETLKVTLTRNNPLIPTTTAPPPNQFQTSP
jgi:hypothetical protein